MLLDMYKLYSNYALIASYVVALLGYNAEQYDRNNRMFRDIFSMLSSGLIKHLFLSSPRMESNGYPEISFLKYCSAL